MYVYVQQWKNVTHTVRMVGFRQGRTGSMGFFWGNCVQGEMNDGWKGYCWILVLSVAIRVQILLSDTVMTDFKSCDLLVTWWFWAPIKHIDMWDMTEHYCLYVMVEYHRQTVWACKCKHTVYLMWFTHTVLQGLYSMNFHVRKNTLYLPLEGD